MACKAKNTYYLVLYRKSLLTSAFKKLSLFEVTWKNIKEMFKLQLSELFLHFQVDKRVKEIIGRKIIGRRWAELLRYKKARPLLKTIELDTLHG